MRRYLPWGVAVIAVILLVWAFTSKSKIVKDAAERREALQERIRDDSLRFEAYDIIDSARKDSINRLQQQLKQHKQEDERLKAISAKLQQQVRLQLSDSTWKIVEPMVQNYEVRLQLAADQHNALLQIINVQTKQITDRDSMLIMMKKTQDKLVQEVNRLNSDLRRTSKANRLLTAAAGVAVILIGVNQIAR